MVLRSAHGHMALHHSHYLLIAAQNKSQKSKSERNPKIKFPTSRTPLRTQHFLNLQTPLPIRHLNNPAYLSRIIHKLICHSIQHPQLIVCRLRHVEQQCLVLSRGREDMSPLVVHLGLYFIAFLVGVVCRPASLVSFETGELV